jgi:N-formylglutamate amidohydrolase
MRETDSVAAMTTTGDPGDSSPPSGAYAERGGGWIPGSRGDPAFRLSADTISAIPVLISAPHGGRCYPPALLRDLRHGSGVALRLEDRHVDLLAQMIAAETGAALIVAHAPRAMIDLKEGIDDREFSQRWTKRLAELDPTLKLRTTGESRDQMSKNLQSLHILSYMGGMVSMLAAVLPS